MTTETRNALVMCAALSRLGAGLGLFVAPRAALRFWLGAEESARAETVMVTRMLAMRELGIGLGTLLAQRTGQRVRLWVQLGALSDATDAALTLVALPHLPRLGGASVAAIAASSAVTLATLSMQVK